MRRQAPRRWRDWRENAREIAIVVIGVLIALLAQQVVQNWEWKQNVAASVRSMRHELFYDDGPQIYMRAAVHPCAQTYLDRIRTAVAADRPRAEIVQLARGYWVQMLTYDSTAHDNATGSDVAVHMPPDQLEAFNQAYNAIPVMDAVGTREAEHLARLRSLKPTGGPLSDYESMEILAAVEALRNADHRMWVGARWALPAMLQLRGTLDPGRIERFMGNAREHYGDCVKDLPPDWPKGVPLAKY
jgi:hypothetical protein